MADISKLSLFLKDVANAIRTKTETQELIPAKNFDVEILNIPEGGIDTSDATATAKDIISPKTAYVNGKKITGAIQLGYSTETSDLNTEIVNTEFKYNNTYNHLFTTKSSEYIFDFITTSSVEEPRLICI